MFYFILVANNVFLNILNLLKIMIVLGIETSCDETSVSIVKKNKKRLSGKVICERTLSQISKHKAFGGVVPELASREHSEALHILVKKVLKNSGLTLNQINAFAATTGPGLLGGLLIGSNYAKTLALASKKPFFSVNHLQGHILVSRMEKKISFPFLCLLVSGGHTQILIAKSYKKFILLGETLDDALGEAFDKTAKILGLDYPGGPLLEKLALKSSNVQEKFNLPRPLINEKSFNFSFSGLKTAIRRVVQNGINEDEKSDLANEFQLCITDCLIAKIEKAIAFFKNKFDNNYFVLAGGVASNNFVREKLQKLCKKKKMSFYVPKPKLCVDNATMIAWTGIEKLLNGEKGDSLQFSPRPRWGLEKL